MKSNAQRQAKYRAQQRALRAAGEPGAREAVLLQLDWNAHLWLRRLAHYHGMTQSEMVEMLVSVAREELASCVSESEMSALCDAINARN